jgi:hypothetical protein
MNALYFIILRETNKVLVIYSKSEEGKASVHANAMQYAIQVNESDLTLECCLCFVRYFCNFVFKIK